MTGYDVIPAGSTVSILFHNIKTLATGETSILQGYIRSFYKDNGQFAQFYPPLSFTTKAITTTFTPAAGTVTLSPATITTSVLSTSTFSVQWNVGSTVTSSDWLVVQFPTDFVDFTKMTSLTTVTVTSPSTPVTAYWLYTDFAVYIQPTSGNSVTGAVTVTFTNLPSPSYTLTGTPTINTWTVISDLKGNDASGSFTTYTLTPATLISDVTITPSSLYTRINDVNYTVGFTINHNVPATGSLLVAFPPSQYNLAHSGPTCEFLVGIPPEATCAVESSSVQNVRIALNGNALSSGTQVKFVIINVNNPTDVTTSPVFYVQTYYDSSTGSSKVIASVSQTLSSITAASIISCGVSVTPEITTVGVATNYLFTIGCGSVIRNNTQLVFVFPGAYTTTELAGPITCDIDHRDILIEDCAFVSPSINIGVLIRKPSTNIALNVLIRNVINPTSPGTYTNFNVQLYKNSMLYAQAASGLQTTLTADTKLTKATNNLDLSLFPYNGGEKAFYFIKLDGVILLDDVYTVQIEFPSSYPAYLGSGIICGNFTPNDQYTPNYALNFETINDYLPFSCSAVSKRVISIQSSVSGQVLYGKTNTPAGTSVFFFIRNVLNPNYFTTTAINLKIRFLNGADLIYYSTSTISVPFVNPPGMLFIDSLTSTDINLRATSTYEVTFENYAPLPSVTDSSVKNYELWIQLPADFNSSFYGVNNVISIPSISSTYTSSPVTSVVAFNWNTDIFMFVPKKATATGTTISFQLANMTNPSTQSFCDYDSSSWAPNTNMKLDIAFASRQFNIITAKTFSATDQYNCLTNYKNRLAITILGSNVLQGGIVQIFTVILEGPAESLTLAPFAPYVTFTPTEVTFSNYESTQFSFQATVSQNAQPGTYTMRWTKQESNSNGLEAFLNVESTSYTIISGSGADNEVPKPSASIASFNTLRSGAEPLQRYLNLTAGPASDLTITIALTTPDPNIHIAIGTNHSFPNLPVKVTFSKGETSKLLFIKADDGAVNNVMTFSFSGTNVGSYNTFLPSIPYIVQPKPTIDAFEVLAISTISVGENNVTIRVALADIGNVYYLVTPKMQVNVTTDELLAQTALSNGGQRFIGVAEALQTLIGDVHYADIPITGLYSQTNYQIFAAGRSVYGNTTEVMNITFPTNKATPGAKITFYTFRQVTSTRWISAVASCLALPTSRLSVVNSSTMVPNRRMLQSSSSVYGFLPYSNEVVIGPSTTNNNPTPSQLASQLLSGTLYKQLLALIPEIDTSEQQTVTTLQANPPYVLVNASIIYTGYYNVTVQMELGEVGKLIAVIAPVNEESLVKPYSQQIYYGYLADNTKVNSRKYTMVATDANGKGNFTFEQLKDGVDYLIYITAGSGLPYEPVDLLPDDQVITLRFTTLKNPSNFLLFCLF